MLAFSNVGKTPNGQQALTCRAMGRKELPIANLITSHPIGDIVRREGEQVYLRAHLTVFERRAIDVYDFCFVQIGLLNLKFLHDLSPKNLYRCVGIYLARLRPVTQAEAGPVTRNVIAAKKFQPRRASRNELCVSSSKSRTFPSCRRPHIPLRGQKGCRPNADSLRFHFR